jgi:predicted Zn-dependent protease
MMFEERLSANEYKMFTEMLVLSEKAGQYNSERLLRLLVKQYPSSHIAELYIGITEHDIFSSGTNFVFSISGTRYAVMSYHRFRGVFNNTSQNRPCLLNRTVKLSVSCVFHTLDIPRCNMPMCMRAYANNLDEHDVKQGALCNWCQKQLDERLAVIRSRPAKQLPQRLWEKRPLVPVLAVPPEDPAQTHDFVIVIQGIVLNREDELKAVQAFFTRNGIPTDIIRRNNYSLLVTQQIFSDPEHPGTNGYEMKQKIKTMGLLYLAQTDDSTFGDEPFSNAYGLLKK